MKLAYPDIETVFEWPKPTVPVLVVEQPLLFRRLLDDIRRSIGGEDTPVVLSLNDKPVNMAKYAELITDFLSFDLNQKPLLTKVCNALERAAVSDEHYLETQTLLSSIERHVTDWMFGFPCDIAASNVSVAALLKAVGVFVRDEYEGEAGEAEKLIDYMELIREFDRDKLFITVNMRGWFSDETVASFMRAVLSHEYKVLMIESCTHPRLEEERRVTIDRDLCEF